VRVARTQVVRDDVPKRVLVKRLTTGSLFVSRASRCGRRVSSLPCEHCREAAENFGDGGESILDGHRRKDRGALLMLRGPMSMVAFVRCTHRLHLGMRLDSVEHPQCEVAGHAKQMAHPPAPPADPKGNRSRCTRGSRAWKWARAQTVMSQISNGATTPIYHARVDGADLYLPEQISVARSGRSR
jgi:hypothetical protein